MLKFTPEVCENYLSAKFKLYQQSTLADRDTAIVGYSGGVDSALVLAMLLWFKKQPGCNLKNIVAMSLSSAVGQTGYIRTRIAYLEMQELYPEVIGLFVPLTCAVNDLTGRLQLATQSLPSLENADFPEDFVKIQTLPMIRQAALYSAAASFVSKGYKPFVAGTINRVENYLGFFGKASEGACDSNFITDLFKSQVRDLARYLGVPEHICSRLATGDVPGYSGTEEMMGFTYDEFEDAYYVLNCDVVDTLEKQDSFDLVKKRVAYWLKANAHKSRAFKNELFLFEWEYSE